MGNNTGIWIRCLSVFNRAYHCSSSEHIQPLLLVPLPASAFSFCAGDQSPVAVTCPWCSLQSLPGLPHAAKALAPLWAGGRSPMLAPDPSAHLLRLNDSWGALLFSAFKLCFLPFLYSDSLMSGCGENLGHGYIQRIAGERGCVMRMMN